MLNPIAMARISKMAEEGDIITLQAMINKIMAVIASREPDESDGMVLASIEHVINEIARPEYA